MVIILLHVNGSVSSLLWGQEAAVASLTTLHIANITIHHCLLHICNHFDLKIWEKSKFGYIMIVFSDPNIEKIIFLLYRNSVCTWLASWRMQRHRIINNFLKWKNTVNILVYALLILMKL